MIDALQPNDHRTVDATAASVKMAGRNCCYIRAKAAGDIVLRMGTGAPIVYTVVITEKLFGMFTEAVFPGTTVQFEEFYRSGGGTGG